MIYLFSAFLLCVQLGLIVLNAKGVLSGWACLGLSIVLFVVQGLIVMAKK